MILKSIAVGIALAALISVPAQAAGLTNAGFETGDLSDWTYSAGFAEVVTEADDAIVTPPFGEHFGPAEGAYFARLTAGVDLGVYSTLSQTFDLAAASRISGNAAFLAFDYLPYDDDAFVRIFDLTTNLVVFASSVGGVGDYGHTSWTAFTSSVLGPGTYSLEAGVRDNVDFGGSSQLLIDGFSIAAVPEPSSWALMIAGFGALGVALRRRRTAALAC